MRCVCFYERLNHTRYILAGAENVMNKKLDRKRKIIYRMYILSNVSLEFRIIR
jgi:hypothetical protein